MKELKLTKEEKLILDQFEAGEFEEVPNMEEEISRASGSGIPYQTLLSTLIHHYVTDKIKINL